MSIIQAMQQQGRSVPPNMASTLENLSETQGAPEADESEYSEEGEEEDMSEFDEDEDEDTEEDPHPAEQSAPVQYGPERPPHQQPQAKVNGH